MEFDHYDFVPQQIADKIIAQAKAGKEGVEEEEDWFTVGPGTPDGGIIDLPEKEPEEELKPKPPTSPSGA